MIIMMQFYNSHYIKVYPSFESPLNQKQHNLMSDRQTLYFVKIMFEIVFMPRFIVSVQKINECLLNLYNRRPEHMTDSHALIDGGMKAQGRRR